MKNKKKVDKKIDKINVQIGQSLLNFRKERGFSREVLSTKMQITQQQLGKYEYGTNQISIARLFLLAQMFGLDINYFLMGINIAAPEESINKVERIDLEITNGLKKVKDKYSKYMINSLIKQLADRE